MVSSKVSLLAMMKKFPELNARLLELAEQYKVTPSGIAVALH